MSIRLGFDAKRLFHNATGLGNYSRTLVRNLRAAHPEFDYRLYTPRPGDHRLTREFLNDPAFTTHYNATPLPAALWRTLALTGQLRRDRIDLYHGLSHEIPLGLGRRGIRSVVTIHDLIFRRHPEWYAGADRLIYDLKFGHACRRADRVIAISEHTKRDIVELYRIDAERIDVVYQSCDPIFYQAAPPDESLTQAYDLPREYLLFVGSLAPRKNLPLILDAYLELDPPDRLPLVVVGRGPAYRDRLLAEVRYTPIRDRILWIDDLSDTRVLRQLYRRAIALLYPSFYEGFGLPVAEALLSGIPVITGNRSSLPEAGGPGALYVDPDRPEDMAGVLHRILGDAGLRHRLAREGGAYVRSRFGPETTTAALVACYRRALD
jgi:glycosyltransferase involved in cell wall biosynthesis